MTATQVDVVVIGGGPCGVTAAAIAAERGLTVRLVDALGVGGRLLNIGVVEEWPTDGDRSAAVLSASLTERALQAGVDFSFDEVVDLNLDGELSVECVQARYQPRAVIIATGCKEATLHLDAEKELLGRGISYCATCDGPLFGGKDVLVVGEGDWAVDEAIVLAEFAAQVTLLHSGPEVLCSRRRRSALRSARNIAVMADASILDLRAEDGRFRSALVSTGSTDRWVDADAVFPAQGWVANLDLLAGHPDLTRGGRITVDAQHRTARPALFAAGDVTRMTTENVAWAIGDGVSAGLSVASQLRHREVS
jgi:thioredoxin reductase (NADPH)